MLKLFTKKYYEVLIVVGIFLVALMQHGFVLNMLGLPDQGDSFVTLFLLKHVGMSFPFDGWETLPYFAEQSGNLFWTEHHLGQSLMFLVIESMVGDLIVSFNVTIILITALNFFTAYWGIKKISGDMVYASIAALLIAFMPYLLHYRAHLHLYAIFPTVICMTVLFTGKHELQLSKIFMSGAVQFLFSITLGLFLVLIFFLTLPLIGKNFSALYSKKNWLQIFSSTTGVLAIGVSVVAMSLLYQYYLTGAERGFERAVSDAVPFSFDISSIFSFFGVMVEPQNHVDFQLNYSLFITVVVIFLLLEKRLDRLVLVLCVSLAFGPYMIFDKQQTDLTLPYYWLYEFLPFMQALRVPVRLVIVVNLVAFFLLAYRWRNIRLGLRRLGAPVIVIYLLINPIYTVSSESVELNKNEKELVLFLRNNEGANVVEYPIWPPSSFNYKFFYYHTLTTNFVRLEGLSSFFPDSYFLTRDVLHTCSVDYCSEYLKEKQVELVILQVTALNDSDLSRWLSGVPKGYYRNIMQNNEFVILKVEY